MKIVFTGDIHLGSKFNNEKGDVRRAETVKVFSDIVDYAVSIGAPCVLIGGDLFDTSYPPPEVEDAVRNIMTSHPDITFYAVCGNHDPLYKTAFYRDVPTNMFLFPDRITKASVGDIDIYGVSIGTVADNTDPWQGFLADGKFITLSHGTLDGDDYPLSSASLADSGAALNLLGHIHKTDARVLSNGRHALYCGTPAGRGFDECGERGFYVIDTDTFSYTFVKTNAKIYREYTVDISDCESSTELMSRLSDFVIPETEIARAILVGSVKTPFEINSDSIVQYTPFVEIKDKSTPDIDLLANVDASTVEGEFVRILVSKLDKCTDDERAEVLDALKAGIIALRRQK